MPTPLKNADVDPLLPYIHAQLRSSGLASMADVRQLQTDLKGVKSTYAKNEYVDAVRIEVVAEADANAKAAFEKTLKLYASKDYAEGIRTEVLTAATAYADAEISELQRVVATKEYALALKEEAIRASLKDANLNAEALIKITSSAYASRDLVEAKKVEAISASLGAQSALVLEERTARVEADGRMSGKWAVTTRAGDVVSGVELFSAV